MGDRGPGVPSARNHCRQVLDSICPDKWFLESLRRALARLLESGAMLHSRAEAPRGLKPAPQGKFLLAQCEGEQRVTGRDRDVLDAIHQVGDGRRGYLAA